MPTYRSSLEFANNGPAQRADEAAVQRILVSTGQPNTPAARLAVNQADINASRNARINLIANQQRAAAAPAATRKPGGASLGSSGGSGSYRASGGGGGGGGGAALPKLNQAQLDWAASLMQGAAPGTITANNLDLPDYQGMAVRAFDPSMYQQALAALQQGQQTDVGTANQSTSDMLNFLNTNYSNAFNNPNNTYATAGQAPGMDQQSMGRYLQDQGVNPNVAAGTFREAQSADQGFGNLWKTLAGNEDIMQRSRVGNAQQYGNQAVNAINAAAAGGRLGIGLGQSQAQAAWQQRADDRAYQDYGIQQQLLQQEAMQNWQRANQVQDTNATNTNSYRNSEMQALLGLLPQLIQNPGLNLPTLQSLGLAA